MNEHLDKITQVITWYEDAELKHLMELNRALTVLSSNLYHVEVERSKYHDKFQRRIYELTANKMTVSRAENQAHMEIPEMYMLRRVMNAAYRVADSIRTNISYMKSELSNTTNQ